METYLTRDSLVNQAHNWPATVFRIPPLFELDQAFLASVLPDSPDSSGSNTDSADLLFFHQERQAMAMPPAFGAVDSSSQYKSTIIKLSWSNDGAHNLIDADLKRLPVTPEWLEKFNVSSYAGFFDLLCLSFGIRHCSQGSTFLAIGPHKFAPCARSGVE